MFRQFAFVVALLLAMQTIAAADEPLRSREDISFDLPAIGASNVCGFPIRISGEGESIFIVFYDKAGDIIREVDVFPALKLTVYRPGTDLSFTTAAPAVLTTYYTNNAAIGSSATAIVTGLLQRIPGIDLDSGRAVFSAVVVGVDAAGVPLIRFTGLISSSGPDLDASQAVQRCAYFQ